MKMGMFHNLGRNKEQTTFVSCPHTEYALRHCLQLGFFYVGKEEQP
jgi:hypothetical protein